MTFRWPESWEPPEDWYGTEDHQRYEDLIDQAKEATAGDGHEEPPAGTWIPGVGEV